jgi:DNA segregation ATPase FtsK/SpoIIIE, S-DNA-T family
MSTSTTNRRRTRSTRRAAGAPLVTPQRKKEILGLILMALALLVALAIGTYDRSDSAGPITIWSLLQPGEQPARNALGIVGAAISRLLVAGFLGYNSLILTGLLFSWGYLLFRSRKAVFLPILTALGTVLAFLSAAIFGWIAHSVEADLFLASGAWGIGVAGWMRQVFGATGSLILLLLGVAVLGLLVVDRDIQRTLDRVADTFRRIWASVSRWWDAVRTSGAERRARKSAMDPAPPARPPRQDAEKEASEPDRPKRRVELPVSHDRYSTALPPVPPLRGAQSPQAGPLTQNELFDAARGTGFPAAPSLPQEPAPSVELRVQERIEEERADWIDRETDDVGEAIPYDFPPVDLLDEPDESEQRIDFEELEENKQVLLDKLATYNIEITAINAVVGPTVTLYELTPAPGVKISRLTALEDDLAMAMAARGIRMIAPIPGKSAIGVEIPNRHRELVRIRDVIGTARFRDARMELPVTIGKTIEGEVYLEDLTKMPHLLIAGATGSGKSVGLNALIAGLLYACHPANLKFVMIDPKKIELQQYARIIEHFIAMPPGSEDPIITDFTQALGALRSCEKEMERRYDLLSRASVRSIKDYNKKLQSGQLYSTNGDGHLPYIVVVIDELADLMMTAGKDIEGPIARLAQMARAVGIHLVLATQRPSVDVITGLIKANFPSRIAYQVASKVDSRTILDQNGAEGLVGNGDLLYMNGSRIIRLQGPFVSVNEVDEITEFIGRQNGGGTYVLPSVDELEETYREIESSEENDDLFEQAARIIVRSQQGSVSLLQRKLSIGYGRAARIVDQLEEAGIVGAFEGSKARQVLVGSEMELDEMLGKGNPLQR